ncbi:MAG: Na/Pi cotransporter family protein [Candidatus Syntrophonatronum acetioxidans]|uniref:Na/Pi cotransporter family protein n=1 Tax=Candidatus Syntrophonatronum acetioxidans TaxID=1795816 RepID=A0A424YDZ7_9FIRM|nr:MAG: Na/Pi cotransporter family protein [Candidatus Syntrophonatronum acetioxidans]
MVNWWGLTFSLLTFIAGLHIMSSGFKLAAGQKLKDFLKLLTFNPLLGVFTGALVTLILQSSSITTVMVVGLVNTGLLNLKQGISIIVGANIGTTVTGQILSFSLIKSAYPLTALGGVILLLFRSRFKRLRGIGKGLIGLGMLFGGLDGMSLALKPLRESTFILSLLIQAGEVPVKGILMGALSTLFLQSSGAVMGIMLALAMQGIVSLPASISIILGADMGTCITSLIASLGTNIHARRTALAHLIFNIIGAFCLLLIFDPFVTLIKIISSELPRQVANAHTMYNLFNTLIIIPFINQFTRLVTYLIPNGRGY